MKKMPVVFIGHGSPMNAIQNNEFTENWRKIAKSIPKPKVILCVSAHWYTKGSKTSDEKNPRTVYDMYGFPKELYEATYDAKGSPQTAEFIKWLLKDKVQIDNSWGIDHGTWSILKHMYPISDIPVLQLSIDSKIDKKSHYELGQALKPLRDKGVLILGSGNIVHNLPKVNWEMNEGYEWAYEFDNYIKQNILEGNYENVLDYENSGESYKLALETPEHFYPLFYVLGACEKGEKVKVYNDKCILGSISMTSFMIG